MEALGKLFNRLMAHQAEQYELLEEIQKLMSGEESPNQLAKRALLTFNTLWQQEYRAKRVTAWAKETGQMRRLLKAITIEDLENRMRVFMRDYTAFVSQNKHALGLFVSAVNQYGRAETRDVFGPMGCAHVPPCRDDAAHTARKMHELRA